MCVEMSEKRESDDKYGVNKIRNLPRRAIPAAVFQDFIKESISFGRLGVGAMKKIGQLWNDTYWFVEQDLTKCGRSKCAVNKYDGGGYSIK